MKEQLTELQALRQVLLHMYARDEIVRKDGADRMSLGCDLADFKNFTFSELKCPKQENYRFMRSSITAKYYHCTLQPRPSDDAIKKQLDKIPRPSGSASSSSA